MSHSIDTVQRFMVTVCSLQQEPEDMTFIMKVISAITKPFPTNKEHFTMA